jgi:hypothetical protein
MQVFMPANLPALTAAFFPEEEGIAYLHAGYGDH